MRQAVSGRFAPGRASGKSNQQVVVELVSGAEPGTTFAYDRIAAALSEGATRYYSREDVQQVVRLANKRLLREHRRLLQNVENVGYLVAHARDHIVKAGERNRKGNRQFKWALETLENVRLEEMTDQERLVHLAQQSVNVELYQQNVRILRRQDDQARLIASLTSRVEQMEGGKAG